MRITGYKIMDRMEELQEQAKTIDAQFKPALYRFKTDLVEKLDPRALMESYLACEEKIAQLQAAQADYNLHVSITVLDGNMTLQCAVKLIGSLNHIKNQWKTASSEQSTNNYYQNTMSRDKDSEYAERVVSVEECLALSSSASRRATLLKQVIRAGNAVELELEIDPAIFSD